MFKKLRINHNGPKILIKTTTIIKPHKIKTIITVTWTQKITQTSRPKTKILKTNLTISGKIITIVQINHNFKIITKSSNKITTSFSRKIITFTKIKQTTIIIFTIIKSSKPKILIITTKTPGMHNPNVACQVATKTNKNHFNQKLKSLDSNNPFVPDQQWTATFTSEKSRPTQQTTI